MTNAATFTYHDLQSIAGKAASSLPTDILVQGISTDSRTLVPGNLFIALRGERFDGHDHVEQVLSNGAVLCGVSHAYYAQASRELRTRCLPVDDTLQLLGSFAWFHRRRFGLPVVAIGGAAGKTSTKDLTAHVLSQVWNVLKTEANHNNRIGTPHTLLQLTDEHDVAVIEIGTNEPGEIETLTAMVQPTHGLITNIDKEHLEKLIDLDGVEREETALFDWLHDKDGLALINMDDERLRKYVVRIPKHVTFGLDHAAEIHPDVDVDDALRPALHIVKGDFTFRARMHATGLAAARNAVCATAVAYALRIPALAVKLGLESYEPDAGHGYARMVVQHIDDLVILNDCYNANPASMRLALETLRHYRASHRIAVIGDMRELGAAAAEEHAAMLAEAESCADLVIVMGDEFRRAAEHVGRPHVIVCDTYAGCAHAIQQNATQGSVVLIKGSRGLAMEHVIDQLHIQH